jgi:hypothetical protein
MDLNHIYTVEEVLEIYHSLKPNDQEAIKTSILIDDNTFEKLVKEDFAKYEPTFKALA